MAGGAREADAPRSRAAGGLFTGLACVYAADFVASPHTRPAEPRPPGRAVGFFQLGTGFWLMYLVFAAALSLVLKYTLPL